MSPAYTTKRNGQRYHYYVSQALLRGEKAKAGTVARVPAFEIERLVVEALAPTQIDGPPTNYANRSNAFWSIPTASKS